MAEICILRRIKRFTAAGAFKNSQGKPLAIIEIMSGVDFIQNVFLAAPQRFHISQKDFVRGAVVNLQQKKERELF